MASCRTLNTSSSIHKITVTKRKDCFVGPVHLTSTTSSSPTSPRRIRVVDSKSRSNMPAASSESPFIHPERPLEPSIRKLIYKPSARVIALVNSVASELWNRDGDGNQHEDALLRSQRTARWYVEKYVSSLASEPSSHSETLAVLAAVFITFKAADFIPGLGRVKMQQLIRAYERACRVVFSEHETGPLIEEICKTEMDIMCITDFNFSPV